MAATSWYLRIAATLWLLPAAAFALIYVEDGDSTDLPAAERLLRLEKRQARLDKLAEDTRQQGETIGYLISVDGKAAEAALKSKVAAFQASRATATAKSAFAEDGSRGLRGYCERAARLLPKMATLADELQRASRDYSAALARTPPGGRDAAAATDKAVGDLRRALDGAVERAQPDQMRTQLAELGPGLPHAYGAFTTLRQIAAEAEMQARALQALAQRLDETNARLAKPIAEFEAGRKENLAVAHALAAAPLDAGSRKRLELVATRAERAFVAPIRQLPPTTYAESTAEARERWQRQAKMASDEVYASIKPLHDAAAACGDNDDPPRQFAQARIAAARTVAQSVNAIETAGRNRIAALQKEAADLDKALAAWRGLLQESLDKSSIVWRQYEAAAPNTTQRQELRQQFDRLTAQKNKAQAAVEAIPQARQSVQAELETLQRTLPGLTPSLQSLKTLFPKEDG